MQVFLASLSFTVAIALAFTVGLALGYSDELDSGKSLGSIDEYLSTQTCTLSAHELPTLGLEVTNGEGVLKHRPTSMEWKFCESFLTAPEPGPVYKGRTCGSRWL